MEPAQADGNMEISGEHVQLSEQGESGSQGDGGYGSGYNSDEIGSDGGYGSGYNSDDTAGAQPKTIMANMIPVEKMKNGWNVMTTMFGKGLAFTKEKASEAYNSDTVQSMKERTSEAAVWTKEKTAEGYAYSKEKAAPVIAVTSQKAGEAWEVTRESLSAASQKARPMVARVKKGAASVGIFPIRPSHGENSSAENSEYEGLSPLSTSPTSTSPLSFSPPLSPKSSRAESPVNLNLPEPPQAPGTSSNNRVAKPLVPHPVSSEAGVLVGVIGVETGVSELTSLSLSEPQSEAQAGPQAPASTSSAAEAAPPAVVDLLN